MIKLACTIGTTDTSVPLGLEIWLDQQQIFNSNHINDTVLFEYDMPDKHGEHILQFVIKNKMQIHTQIDDKGTIVKDACLRLTDLTIDGFEIYNVLRLAVYEHNFNGTGEKTQSRFYKDLGCNGTLTIPFSTPVYDWLVDNFK